MNPWGQNSTDGVSGSADFEETLRLIARLAPPEGLEERVQAGLKAAPALGAVQILAWPTALRLDSAWMRSAAAAAIVAVVVGGSWSVYSRVQSIQPTRAITVPLHLSTRGGFSSAGAMRTPQTLNGPIVVEHPVISTPLSVPTAVKAGPQVKQAPLISSKTKAARKAIARPAVPQSEVVPAR